mgnify:FL=1|tara:strand:+ start:43 stop:717 length:675 start_codon:yes stop_codon:yes gene_type:complete
MIRKFKHQKFTVKNPEKGDRSKFTDANALGFGWRPGGKRFSVEIDSCEIDGAGGSEGLKLSFCHDIVVKNSTILGGYEDCVDIVRGSNISFENCKFISQGSAQHITIKAGVKNVSFKKCKFINPFRSVINGACIDLGNWADYDDVDRPKTRSISIDNCSMENIRFKALYRRLYAESPEVNSSQGFGIKVPNLFVRIFWKMQRKGWLGERRRFPESWLKVYDIEK